MKAPVLLVLTDSFPAANQAPAYAGSLAGPLGAGTSSPPSLRPPNDTTAL